MMSDFDIYESEIEELYREPEEPKVELTIEEAKCIRQIIEDFAPIAIWAKYETAIEKLISQIEQAERK